MDKSFCSAWPSKENWKKRECWTLGTQQRNAGHFVSLRAGPTFFLLYLFFTWPIIQLAIINLCASCWAMKNKLKKDFSLTLCRPGRCLPNPAAGQDKEKRKGDECEHEEVVSGTKWSVRNAAAEWNSVAKRLPHFHFLFSLLFINLGDFSVLFLFSLGAQIINNKKKKMPLAVSASDCVPVHTVHRQRALRAYTYSGTGPISLSFFLCFFVGPVPVSGRASA